MNIILCKYGFEDSTGQYGFGSPKNIIIRVVKLFICRFKLNYYLPIWSECRIAIEIKMHRQDFVGRLNNSNLGMYK